MSGARARVSVQRRGPVAVAHIDGDVDLSNALDVERALAGGTVGADSVVLDLGGLASVDSAGLAVLSRLASGRIVAGGTVRLVVPDDVLIRQTMQAAGLDSVVTIDRSVDAAVIALATIRGIPDTVRDVPG